MKIETLGPTARRWAVGFCTLAFGFAAICIFLPVASTDEYATAYTTIGAQYWPLNRIASVLGFWFIFQPAWIAVALGVMGLYFVSTCNDSVCDYIKFALIALAVVVGLMVLVLVGAEGSLMFASLYFLENPQGDWTPINDLLYGGDIGIAILETFGDEISDRWVFSIIIHVGMVIAMFVAYYQMDDTEFVDVEIPGMAGDNNRET